MGEPGHDARPAVLWRQRPVRRARLPACLIVVCAILQADGSAPGDSAAQASTRIAADQAMARAQELRAQWTAASRNEAIQAYEEALASWRELGAAERVAETLNALGELYHIQGDPQRALEHHEQALRLFEDLGELSSVAAAASDAAQAYLRLGQNEEASGYCTRALNASQDARDRRRQAEALVCLGDVQYERGAHERALEHYQAALRMSRGAGDERGQAQALLSSGFVYADMSAVSEAFEAYSLAHDLWRSVGDPRGAAITLTAIGHLHSTLGEKQRALDLYAEAEPFFEPMGDPYWAVGLLNGMAYVYAQLGEEEVALEYYEEALSINRSIKSRAGEAFTLLDVGRVRAALGQLDTALADCERALRLFESQGNRRLMAVALVDIGTIHDLKGSAEEALEYYKEALSLARSLGFRREEARALSRIGDVYHAVGEQAKALQHHRQALPLHRATANRFGESACLMSIGLVERDLGHLGRAQEEMEAALDLVESLRGNVASLALRSSFVASVYRHYETYIDLLMQRARASPSKGFEAVAFWANERSRARSLLDSLAEARVNIRQGVEPELLEREGALLRSLNARAARQAQLLDGEPDEKEAEALASQIRETNEEYERVRALIRSQSPRYAALTQPEPLRLDEVQERVLDDETLLLEYALGEKRSFLWVVERTRHVSFELPGRAEIEEAARKLHDRLTARQPRAGETATGYNRRVRAADSQVWETAARLSEMVLGPVADRLGARRLLVVSDGLLQWIPFGALPVPGTSSGEDPVPLVAEHEVVRLPSASTLAVLREDLSGREPAPLSVAVLADPVFEADDPRIVGRATDRRGTVGIAPVVPDRHRGPRYPGRLRQAGLRMARLLSSRREAEIVVALAPPGQRMKAVDFRASRRTATSPELGRYKVVHFATHGILDSEHPELSGIALSMVDEQGEPQDGFLRLHDIYNLDLPVELVVLSACDSALGEDVRGEGLVGIVRGFMYAGAARVVASLWRVDDEATAELMQRFYRKMLKEHLPPAAALREAQVALWKQRRWRSPFYWAAFELQGEWRGWP